MDQNRTILIIAAIIAVLVLVWVLYPRPAVGPTTPPAATTTPK